MEQSDWIGPAIVAAAIAGTVNVAGWFFTIWRDRQGARRRRAERVRDIQTALKAEIIHYTDVLALFDLDVAWTETVDRMRSEPEYSPRFPTEQNDTIFRSILTEIHVLPGAVIEPVVRYYSQLFAIEALIQDLRSDAFLKVEDVDQRIAMVTDLFSLKQEALRMGRVAVEAIEDSLNGSGAPSDVSRRDAGRSGQR